VKWPGKSAGAPVGKVEISFEKAPVTRRIRINIE
jgi:hypothetical protein